MRTRSHGLAIGLLVLLTLYISASEASALQATVTGSLTGWVVDPTGAVIPRAQIKATNEATGAQYKSQADNQGHYQLSSLPPGNYRVQFNAQGFAEVTKTAIAVSASNGASLDVSLQVGTGGGPVVEPALVPGDHRGGGELPLVPFVGGIAGKVVDSRKRTIAGVRVIASTAAGDVVTVTGSDGLYCLYLVAGNYRVRFESAGFRTQAKDAVRATASRVTGLNIRLKRIR